MRTFAEQFLLLDEPPHLRVKALVAAIAGPDDELKARALERVEDAALHVHDVLRARIVVDQRDEVGAAKRERARLGIGREAMLRDDRLPLLAGLLAGARG